MHLFTALTYEIQMIMINQSKSILVLGIDPSIATIPNIYTEKELNLEEYANYLTKMESVE